MNLSGSIPFFNANAEKSSGVRMRKRSPWIA